MKELFGKLFDEENLILRFMARVGDLIALNALFLLCSLPLVTIGPSAVVMIKVIQGYATGTEPKMIRTFFRAFRKNFKQATLVWCALAAVLAILGYNLALISANFAGSAAFALECAMGVVLFAVLGVAAYVFPLIARYENTLPQHLANALVLCVGRLPRTLVMVLLNALPFLVLYFSTTLFLYSIALWVLIGFAGICFLDCLLLRGVLRKIEGTEAQPDDLE